MKDQNTLTAFQQDVLKQEIDLVDKTIARIDEIQLRLKNWCIVVWGGSLFFIARDLGNPPLLVLVTVVIPVLFGISDITWSRQLLVVNYREEKISAFINGEGDRNFFLLDPIAKKSLGDRDFRFKTSTRRAMFHKGIFLFYLSLAIISVVLAIYLFMK